MDYEVIVMIRHNKEAVNLNVLVFGGSLKSYNVELGQYLDVLVLQFRCSLLPTFNIC